MSVGFVYIILPGGDFFKLGYTTGTPKDLFLRYKTYYGKDIRGYLFKSDNCVNDEKILLGKFKNSIKSGELLDIDSFDDVINEIKLLTNKEGDEFNHNNISLIDEKHKIIFPNFASTTQAESNEQHISKDYQYDFQCDKCLKIFDRERNLDRHLNRKKSCVDDEDDIDKSVTCNICKKTYFYKSNYYRHKKNCK